MKKLLLLLILSLFILTACNEDVYEWDENYKVIDSKFHMKKMALVDIDDDGDNDLIGLNLTQYMLSGIIGIYINNSSSNNVKFDSQYGSLNFDMDYYYDYRGDFNILNMNPGTTNSPDLFMNKTFYEKVGNEWEERKSWSDGLRGSCIDGILFGDLNNDGLTDMMDISNGYIFENIGNENQPSWGLMATGTKTLKNYEDGVLYDFDRDGDLDIFAIGYYKDYNNSWYDFLVACYRNSGTPEIPYFQPDYDMSQKLNEAVNHEMEGISYTLNSITAGYISPAYPSNIFIQAGGSLIIFPYKP